MPLIWLLLSPFGWCVQWINMVLSLLVLSEFLLEVPSSIKAAWLKIGDSFSIGCPRATRRLRNLLTRSSKFSVVFWSQYLLSSPIIKPFRQLGGCADSGGRYRYRFSGFWKVEKVIDEPFMSILRSRKVVWVEGSSIVHFSTPQLFSLFF